MIGLPVLLAACVIGGVPAQCATVTVPENRAVPTGRTIDLSVAVLPATMPSARRPDPLFYIVGGPGGVASEELPAVAWSFAGINAHRDIVFVDQRGVGGSNPLSCAIATGVSSLEEMVAACLGVIDADITMYRTPEAMDDLDEVRQALGYDQIDLYGISYGATAAQVYLRRHPDSVRAVVLDGATLLDIPVLERWASNGQRALDLVARRCRAELACATTFPYWYKRFPALLKKLAARPVSVGGIAVGAASTAVTIESMTATAAGAASVPYTLAKAEGGTLGPLAREIGYANDQVVALMPPAIFCTEPWAAQDPAKVLADARGTYLAYSEPANAAFMQQLCAAWPKPDMTGEDWSRVRSQVPVLDLVGGADPKDPIGNVAGITEAMPNTKVVVAPGQGHGVGWLGCLPNVIDRFLERGSALGLDTSCVKLMSTPPFRLR